MAIEDVVDKLLSKREQNEIVKGHNIPFRYLTTPEDIQKELGIEKPEEMSIMKLSDTIFFNNPEYPFIMGDSDVIITVLKKHESKKIK